jgi:hypothetical protein
MRTDERCGEPDLAAREGNTPHPWTPDECAGANTSFAMSMHGVLLRFRNC